MKTSVSIIFSLFLIALPFSSQALFDKKSAEEQRQELQDERKVALDKLYAEKPNTREELKSAKGCAVFSSLGQVEKAIEHHQKSLVIATELGDIARQGRVRHNLDLAKAL